MPPSDFVLRRRDPIFFHSDTPLLFAHRGGAREVPESTRLAFAYALAEARADVLELDVQLTSDGEMVVWHGPQLDNVLIETLGTVQDPCARRTAGRWEIRHFTWTELQRAWVADPGTPHEALGDVPRVHERCLLTLEQFLAEFRDAPLNIELKECFRESHLEKVIKLLDAQAADRPLVIASNRNGGLIRRFRALTADRYATNLPALATAGGEAAALLGLLGRFNLRRRAAQLPYGAALSSRRFIDQMRDAGGGTYVFLTPFPLHAGLDHGEGTPCRADLFAILDRGVDGIMTDRPKRVRVLMDEWIAAHPIPA